MASALVHVKRAFGWNLGKVVPSAEELSALAAAGTTDPAAARYAAWRRSLLLVATVPTLLAFVLAALDAAEEDLGDYQPLGLVVEGLVVLASAVLPLACFLGARSWTRPASAAGLLRAAWIAAFVAPFVRALVPVDLLYHVDEGTVPAALAGVVDPEQAERLLKLKDMAMEFILSGGTYLLLLPAVLSLIPGAVNGCLRIKSLIPAAQLPGWLLVCAAPIFLLFWLVILVVVNDAAQSSLLVFGVLLWAGSPIVFSLQGRVFVQSQISEADAAKIGGVKRKVGLIALAGIGLMLTFAVTTKVAGLHLVGLDSETALATHLDELREADDQMTLEDVQGAYAASSSFMYALDLSSWRMIVDILAKLLVVTAIFADLVIRATLSGWKNDRALRAAAGASGYDASAAAVVAAISPAGTAPP